MLTEEKIPVHDAVRGACELLGLDPLHIANEGQFLAVVAPEYADAALNALSLTAGGRGGSDNRRSARAASWSGSGHDALRWKQNCRHARRRSAPAHLLRSGFRKCHGNRYAGWLLKVEERLLARNQIVEEFFSREAFGWLKLAAPCPSVFSREAACLRLDAALMPPMRSTFPSNLFIP